MKIVKTAVLSAFGILAAVLVLGCSSPVFSPESAGAAGAGTSPEAYTDLDKPFTVTFTIGQDGTSRSVAGLEANKIYVAGAEGIRNFIQLVVVDQGAKGIAGFAEDRKTSGNSTEFSLSLDRLTRDKTYAFLLLMGHWERDGFESDGTTYKYKGASPTLLAAGLKQGQKLNPSGDTTVTITMYPLVVDIKFQRADGLIVEPEITNGKPQPAYIPAGTSENPWTVTWTMQRAAAGTDGFVTALIPAQKLITTTGDELLIKDKKILRSGSAVSSSGTGSTGKSVSYAIPAGDTANGDKGNVNFNLEYLPFNLDAGAWSGRTSVYFPDLDSQGPVWIIRNGTNDLAQNTDTDFVNFGKNGSNGNGAVRWEVKIQPGVPVDSDLRVYDGRFIDTREPNFPIIDFKTDGYSGKAEVWYSVGPTGYQMPAPVLFVWIDSVVVGGPYSKIIPVSEYLAGYGYDIYVIITKDGKISAPELIRSSQGSAAIDYIWGIDLTGAVTPPETGNSPDGNFYPPADSEYTGESINWSPADNPFEANTPYTATVTLTAEEGYTFPDSEDLVIHDGAAVSISSNTGDTITVEISFPATSGSSTTVTDTALGGILFPCAGDTGNTAFPSSSSQYTGSEVSWYKGASPANGAFAAGDAYTAQVTLTAEDGYTFTGVGAFTFSGAAVTTSSNTGSTITVRITFPPAPARVSALDLSQALSPPKTGRYPDVDIASYEYEAPKVEWYYNNGQPFPLTAPFGSKGNYDYSVLFVLTANDGFTFNGLDNAFTYGSSDTVTVQIMHNSGDTVWGRVYFPLPNPWF